MEMSATQKVGQEIKKVRYRMGLTQKELGDRLNVTDRAVSKWENGVSHS